MATTIPRINQSQVVSNLDTYNHTALQNSMYSVSVDMSELPPSGLSIVIQQNGSPKATSAAPAATQGNVKLQVLLNCAINDVISVVLSSSQNSDKMINAVKGIINIRVGQI